MFMGKPRPPEVEQATDILLFTLADNGTRDVCALASRLLEAERARQQDETFKHEVRKAATAGFVRGFTSAVNGNGQAYINIGSSLHNSRLGAWGFTQEAGFREIKQYQVSEQLDGRQCPVCEAMHGRKFEVAPAEKKLEQWLGAKNPDDLKALAPWPKQDKNSVAKLRAMSNDRLSSNGWDTPPYHPLCRGILVPAGQIKEKLPTPRVEDTMENPIIGKPDPALEAQPIIEAPDPHQLPFTGSVAEYRDRFFVEGVTPEDILARHDPKAKTIIARYEADLAKGKSTRELYHDGYDWNDERKQLHNEIIAKILNPVDVARATPPPGVKPKVTVLGGRGGSGKTFLTEGVDEKFFKKNGYGKGAPVDLSDKIVLNSDEIKKLLPEYEGWNAGLLHQEGSELLKRIESIAQERRLNVVLDTTLAGRSKALGNLQNYLDAGFEAEGYYMHLPRQEAAFRAVFRGIGGEKRYVPIDIILGNLDNEDSFDAMKKFFTRWGAWDNQVPQGTLPRFIGGENLPSYVPLNNPAGGGPSIPGKRRRKPKPPPVQVYTLPGVKPLKGVAVEENIDETFDYLGSHAYPGDRPSIEQNAQARVRTNYEKAGTRIAEHSTLDEAAALARLEPHEAAALHQYTETAYRQVNGHLGGWRNLSETSARLVTGYGLVLDKAMAKLPSYGAKTTYRGMTVENHTIQAHRETFQVGRTINLGYFMSTASADNAAFGGNLKYVVHGKKNGGGKSVTPYSQYGYDETEVLFRPGTTFKVLNVEDGVDRYGDPSMVIYLEEVGATRKYDVTEEQALWILEAKKQQVAAELEFLRTGKEWNPSPVWKDKMKIEKD
jgi:hypothetical protein